MVTTKLHIIYALYKYHHFNSTSDELIIGLLERCAGLLDVESTTPPTLRLLKTKIYNNNPIIITNCKTTITINAIEVLFHALLSSLLLITIGVTTDVVIG